MEIAVKVNTKVANDCSLTSVNSVQMLFALLQMELAKDHKDGAKNLIENVKQNQAKSKEHAKLIADVNAVLGSKDDDGDKKTRGDNLRKLKDRCVSLGIDANASFFGDKVSLAEGQKLVTSLQGLQEEYGTKNQTLMVQIQDLLGQYNANVQGANSAVQQSNNVLQTLARAG